MIINGVNLEESDCTSKSGAVSKLQLMGAFSKNINPLRDPEYIVNDMYIKGMFTNDKIELSQQELVDLLKKCRHAQPERSVSFNELELQDFVTLIWNASIENDDSYCDNCSTCNDDDHSCHEEIKTANTKALSIISKQEDPPGDWSDFREQLHSALDY